MWRIMSFCFGENWGSNVSIVHSFPQVTWLKMLEETGSELGKELCGWLKEFHGCWWCLYTVRLFWWSLKVDYISPYTVGNLELYSSGKVTSLGPEKYQSWSSSILSLFLVYKWEKCYFICNLLGFYKREKLDFLSIMVRIQSWEVIVLLVGGSFIGWWPCDVHILREPL